MTQASIKRAKMSELFGNLICPHCSAEVVTPLGRNPHRDFQEEKMVLVPNQIGTCPLCRNYYTVDEEVALKHNHYWYPEDPEFQK